MTIETAQPASSSPLRLRSRDSGSTRVLTLAGECDLATRDALGAGLADAMSGNPGALVVDLTDVSFCDAACAGMLLAVARQIPVGLVKPTRIVARSLDLLAPRALLPRWATVDAALAGLLASQDTLLLGAGSDAGCGAGNRVVAAAGGLVRLPGGPGGTLDSGTLDSGMSDTGAEGPFDRLARLAARVLGAPLAFVTIVDEPRSSWNRQLGGGPSALGDGRSPVFESFCQYVVESGGAMVVSDAATDPRTRDNLVVGTMGVRAWAGFPLHAPDGAVLGTFCVTDTTPRDWTVEDLEVLATLADAAASEVALRKAARRSDETSEVLQRSMLTDLPEVRDVGLVARYLPARETAQVGGDWYDAFVLPDGVTALVIGDVVGHDLPAAARMGQLRNLLRGIACHTNPAPHHVLSGLDTVAYRLQVADLATAVYARIEGPDGGPWQLRWANAGHPPPLLVTVDGATRYLDQPSGQLLGLGTGQHTDGTTALPPQSTLLLYTDGLVESRHVPIDVGLDLLAAAAAEAAGQSLEQFCDHLVAELAGDATDDVTLLAVRIPAPR